MGEYTEASFLYRKRGFFYFARRVPKDLRSHYARDKIVLALQTRSIATARLRANSLASKLEEEWLALRWKASSDPFERFRTTSAQQLPSASNAPLLSETKRIYVEAKKTVKGDRFEQSADRAVGYAVKLLGDKPIDTYTRPEANQLRDALVSRGLAKSSIQRNLNTIRAMINFAVSELGLPEIRTFSSIYLGEPDQRTEGRKPIPTEVVFKIQSECRKLDDEARWLIALISDTGMRLAEAAGLLVTDLDLSDPYPHIRLRAHPWRRLKTKSSERVVPLTGAALWAALRAREASQGQFLFPRYCSEDGCKSNSASAALNKWLGKRVPDGCVIHSFRHSFRDRLRAVECPPDIIDRLGGWSVGGVGESYGSGYPLEVLYGWAERIKKACAVHDIANR